MMRSLVSYFEGAKLHFTVNQYKSHVAPVDSNPIIPSVKEGSNEASTL